MMQHFRILMVQFCIHLVLDLHAVSMVDARRRKKVHCMEYKAHEYYMKQCGIHVPEFIGCDVQGEKIMVGEQMPIGALVYCCDKTGEIMHKMELISSRICGCLFDGKVLNLGNETNVGEHIIMTCQEVEGASGMVITGCEWQGIKIPVGEGTIADQIQFDCKEDAKGRIALEPTFCVHETAEMIGMDSSAVIDSVRYQCVRTARYAATLIIAACVVNGIDIPYESIGEADGVIYSCNEDQACGSPKLEEIACQGDGMNVMIGNFNIRGDQVFTCQKDLSGNIGMILTGCYFMGNNVKLDDIFVNEYTSYKCEINGEEKGAQMVVKGCNLNGNFFEIEQTANFNGFQHTCTIINNKGQMIKTACLYGSDVIGVGEPVRVGSYESTCTILTDGDLLLAPSGCFFKDLRIDVGKTIDIKGTKVICEEKNGSLSMRKI